MFVDTEVLGVRALSVSYDDTPALVDVHLDVGAGQVLALLGPSGSGKSTLLHTVAGFHSPSAGEVWLEGRKVASPELAIPPERRNVAMVFQNYALWPHLTALDTVAYPIRRRGVRRAEARREAEQILARLRVRDLAHRRPAELSGGEQQRVGLGRALARDAALYLFDEPTAHLDTHVRGVFLDELMTRLRDTGAAALYATHDAEEALGAADRVALLTAGRVVQVGTPEEVYHRPVDMWAARLTGPASVLETPLGDVLVRPEWARLDGEGPEEGPGKGPEEGPEHTATIMDVHFRGPHSDYVLDTEGGRLLLRELGPPRHAPGARVGWRLCESWPVQPSSREAGPA